MEVINTEVIPNKRRKVNEQGQESLSDEFTIAIDALTSASQIIETKVSGLKEREVAVEKRIQEMEALEARLIAAEKRIEDDTHDVISLNVGGSTFSTSKATLLKHKGSYFEELVKTGQCLQEGKFIDRDPDEFSDILNFLRDGKLRPDRLSRSSSLEFSFYGVLPNEYLTSPLQNAIRSWLPNRKFMQVYNGDSWPASLDVEGPLLVIVRADGCLFGGYIGEVDSHTRHGNVPQPHMENDLPSFIFTLTNPHGIPPTMYSLNASVLGIPVCLDEEALFGVSFLSQSKATEEAVQGNEESDGDTSESEEDEDEYQDQNDEDEDKDEAEEITKADLNISAGTSHFPLCYADTTGKGAKTFTGGEWFSVSDIVIYSVSN